MVAGVNYPEEPAISSPGILTLTSAPYGGWTTQQSPKAVYHNGQTYFGWVNDASPGIYIAQYDHTAETVTTPFLLDGAGGDTHNAPALLVRDSDKRILVAMCAHNGANMIIRISTNAEDATAWGSAVNIDSSIGASDYTYPILCQLTGVTNDPIYLFYRDQSGNTGRLAFTKSTDGGATWSARTIVMTAATDQRGYWSIRSTATRIDIMAVDRDPYGSEGAVDLGHMYIDGATGNYFKSDGTQITASLPFTHAELTQLETDLTGVYSGDGISGANPIFTYLIDNGDSTVDAIYARWDGSSWDKGTVYADESHFPFDRYFGGLVVNRADPEEVFTCLKSGTNTSEMWTYTSADLGLTWDSGTAITTGSGDLNCTVIAVENGDASLPCIWLRGTITSSTNFSFGIRGLGR